MKRYFTWTLAASLLAGSLGAAPLEAGEPSPVGVVNFGLCYQDSKLGKQEAANFEGIRTQMTTLLEDTEKQLNDVATKLKDSDYLDGLSPEAENELKAKFSLLNEEMNRYQNQYYQVLNQAQMRIGQNLVGVVALASENIAKKRKLSMVFNREACFFSDNELDLTLDVIAEMDRMFEQEMRAQATANQTATNQAAPLTH